MAKRFFWFMLAALLFMVVAGLCGCKSVKYVPVETVRTEYREADTTAICNRLLKFFDSRKEKESKSDSLVDRTKETVVVNTEGDTVRHYKTKYVYVSTNREKALDVENKMLRDSVSVLNTRLESAKADSIPVPYPVEKQLTKWQQTKMDFGGIAFGGMVVGVVLIAVLAWLARKRRK